MNTPSTSPFSERETEMIYDFIQVEADLRRCLGFTKSFLYLDESWKTLGYEAFNREGPFDLWFPQLFASEFSRWRSSSVVIYVEDLAESLVAHFVLTLTPPVRALVYDRVSGDMEWFDPVGSLSGVLSAAMAEAHKN